jgi:hypothetical protein
MKITNEAAAPATSLLARRLARSWRDRLVYGAHKTVSQLQGAGGLQKALAGGRIVDVLAAEATVARLGSAPILSDLAPYGLAFARLAPHLLIDKFEVNETLKRSGVRIPPQLRADAVSPRQAAETLGLPLVVKARVGAAGTGVRVAATVDEIERALARLSGGDPGRAFYQKHIEGEMVMYDVVSGETHPLIEHGIMVADVQWKLGPSARVRLFDDPDLISAGRLAVRTLGCRGFAEIGFLRDAMGALWHVDANCRPWGNMISLLSIGIDFADAYTSLVLGKAYAPPRGRAPPAPGEEVSVLPFALYQAASHGSLGEIWSHAAAFAIICRRGPGARYAAPIAAKVTAILIARLIRRLRRPSDGSGRNAERPGF